VPEGPRALQHPEAPPAGGGEEGLQRLPGPEDKDLHPVAGLEEEHPPEVLPRSGEEGRLVREPGLFEDRRGGIVVGEARDGKGGMDLPIHGGASA
jgi:hypothetical protein